MATRDELLDLARPWLKLIFWLLVASILVFALDQLYPLIDWILRVLQPFTIALIVAYVFHPIVTFVQKKLRLGRLAGIAVLGLTIAGLLIGVLIWLVPVLWDQCASIVSDLSKLDDNVESFMKRHHYSAASVIQVKQWLDRLGTQIQLSLGNMVSDLGSIKPVAEGGLTAVRNVAGGVFSGVRATVVFIGTIAFVIIIAFYYLIDMDAIPHIIRKMLPPAQRERIWDILLQADHGVGGFLRGQLIACLIVGVTTSILLVSVGMRQYAILIGSFAGLMHLIPYLGPVAGGTPAILWVLLSERFTSWSQRGLYVLIVVIGFSVIETFDGLVTQPYVVGRRASLHPLLVMLALAVGAQFGIGGMIIAVPSACFARVLWVELYWKNRTE